LPCQSRKIPEKIPNPKVDCGTKARNGPSRSNEGVIPKNKEGKRKWRIVSGLYSKEGV
jgi:hypothetical protein